MACACGGTCSRCVSAGKIIPARLKLAQRLAPRVDKLRQRLTDFGLRVYSVDLVWTKWTGLERGAGDEYEIARVPIRPNPLVEDLTSVSLSPFAAGILPVGSVRLSQITATLFFENLIGTAVPDAQYFMQCGLPVPPCSQGTPPELLSLCDPSSALAQVTSASEVWDRLPRNVSFYYEVVQNDVPTPPRPKFRPFSLPFKRPGKFDWSIVLERISEDRNRDALTRTQVEGGV